MYTAQTSQKDGLAFKPVPAQYFSGLANGVAAYMKAVDSNEPATDQVLFQAYTLQLQNAIQNGNLYFACNLNNKGASTDDLWYGWNGQYYYLFPSQYNQNIPGPLAQAGLSGIGASTCSNPYVLRKAVKSK